jgi:hypothetical protein
MFKLKIVVRAGFLLSLFSPGFVSAQNQEVTQLKTNDIAHRGNSISPDLFGVFFEDLSYAADGGLYAELLQMVRLSIVRAIVKSGIH